MNKLFTILGMTAILTFASCSSVGNLNPMSLITGNNWVLNSLLGNSLSGSLFSGGLPFLNFMDEGRLTGFTGCNNFTGNFDLDASGINLDPGAVTKKACEGDGENQFLSALSKVNNYKVSKNKLTLMDGATELLGFVSQR